MNIIDILNYFIDESVIETLGNWYPRVIAVMSCVLPALFAGTFCALILMIVWIVAKGMMRK